MLHYHPTLRGAFEPIDQVARRELIDNSSKAADAEFLKQLTQVRSLTIRNRMDRPDLTASCHPLRSLMAIGSR